jgi:hypothetical protein
VLGLVELRDVLPRGVDALGRDRPAEAEGLAARALPAQLAHEAAADLEQAAGLLRRLVAQPRDQRRHELGLERVDQVLRQHGLGHARAGDRRDRVDQDVLLLALEREGLGEAVDAELGHRVVGLAEVAVDAGGRRGHDDAAVALVAHQAPRGGGALVAAEDVDLVDEVPVGLAHLLERDVAEDAGVVDEDVDLAEGVDGGLDDGVAVLDRVVVGDRGAAGGLDLVDDLVGGRARLALAGEAAAEIVDDDLGAARREEQRVGAPQSATGAGDDRDLAIEPQFLAHRMFSRALSVVPGVGWRRRRGGRGDDRRKHAPPVGDELVGAALLAVQTRGGGGADHHVQREVERDRVAGRGGQRRAEHDAGLVDDALAHQLLDRRERGAQLGVGARGGAQLDRDLEHRAGEALPQELEHRVDAGRAGGERRRALLEIAAAALGEVGDGGDQQRGLAGEVMEQRAARDAGAALDLERGGAREAELDQAVDRGLEQRMPHLVPALSLGPRSARGLRRHRGKAYRRRNSQSRLFVLRAA